MSTGWSKFSRGGNLSNSKSQERQKKSQGWGCHPVATGLMDRLSILTPHSCYLVQPVDNSPDSVLIPWHRYSKKRTEKYDFGPIKEFSELQSVRNCTDWERIRWDGCRHVPSIYLKGMQNLIRRNIILYLAVTIIS